MISLIAAIGAKSRALGKGNKLLWHIPADMKRFKELTTGHTVVMGRKTYESIGRPLPNRTNIVITRDPAWHADGVTTMHSLEEALALDQDAFVIGGGEIYKGALGVAERLYLTLIDEPAGFDPAQDADTFFPAYETLFTKVVANESHTAPIPHRFVTLER